MDERAFSDFPSSYIWHSKSESPAQMLTALVYGRLEDPEDMIVPVRRHIAVSELLASSFSSTVPALSRPFT